MKNNLVYGVLRFIVSRMNEYNINYYVVGAIGAYIDANIALEREHDDLDIMIEEKDIDKLKAIFKDSDFDFFDNRLKSSKILNEYGYPDGGDHELIANHKYSNFHIGFFLFRYTNEDYTIIEYFRDDVFQKKLERTLPIEYFKYQYNPLIKNYLGLNIKVVRKELIYKNKKIMTREKDLFDIEKLEPHINLEILDNLKCLSKYRISNIINVCKRN